jgi:hypothetical protein
MGTTQQARYSVLIPYPLRRADPSEFSFRIRVTSHSAFGDRSPGHGDSVSPCLPRTSLAFVPPATTTSSARGVPTLRRRRYHLALTAMARPRKPARRDRLRSRSWTTFVVSSLPLQLVGSFDGLDARLIVQVELDPHTGDIISISGDGVAIRRTCGLLREVAGREPLGMPEADHDRAPDHGKRPMGEPRTHARLGLESLPETVTTINVTGSSGSSSTGRMSDQEVRERARPANILATLRRERANPPSGLRLTDAPVDRQPGSPSATPAKQTPFLGSKSNHPRAGAPGHPPRFFLPDAAGRLRLAPSALNTQT